MLKRISKINSRSLCAAAVFASLSELVSSSHGQVVTYTAVDLLVQHNSLLTAIGLNDNGQVVGYTTAGSTQLPFVYTPNGPGNGFTTIPGIPSSRNSKATGINDAGLVVGNDGVTGNGFVYSFGSSAATEVSPIASGVLTFSGVNNNGVAVGTSSTAGGGTTLITYDSPSGLLTDVGTSFTGSSNSSSGTAINDNNTVLGYGIQNAAPANSYPSHVQPFVASPMSGGYTFTNVGNAVEATIAVGGSSPGYYARQGLSASGEVAGTISPYFNGGYGSGTGYVYNASGGAVTNVGFVNTVNSIADVNGVPEAVGSSYTDNYTGPNGGYVHGLDAFTYTSSGGMANLYYAIPNYLLNSAIAINSVGDILATGFANGDSTNTMRYLLLTPHIISSLTYTGAVSGVWDTSTANFTPANYADGVYVTFDDSAVGPTTINIPSPVNPAGVIFNNSSKSYVITGASISGASTTLTLNGSGMVALNNSNTFAGAVSLNVGSLTIGSTGSLASNSITLVRNAKMAVQDGGMLTSTALTLSLSPGSSVTIAPTSPGKVVLQLASVLIGNYNSQLDVGNTDVIFHDYPAAGASYYIENGYAGGTWQGSGMVSSVARNDTTHLTTLGTIQNSQDGTPTGTALYDTFDGVPVLDSDTLVKYTYYGDANLDGQVDGSDYSLIDSAYLANQSGDSFPLTGWYNGDFNYDGVIDGSDYTLLDNAFNTQGTRFSGSVPDAVSTSQIADPGRSGTVPEPASLSLISVAVLSTLRRRPR